MDVSLHDALYKVSFVNLIMYGAAVPLYDDEKNETPVFDESMDANNPNNFSDDEDEIVVKV